MNWDAMLVCGAKRAMGNNTANKPINPYKPDANAWLDGWADVLDVINSHSQVPANNTLCLVGIRLLRHASTCGDLQAALFVAKIHQRLQRHVNRGPHVHRRWPSWQA